MRSMKSPTIRLPVETDESVFVTAYTNSGDIRVRFEPKGYLPEGLFRYVLRSVQTPHKIRPDQDTRVLQDGSIEFIRGPVTIVAKANGRKVDMQVTVRLPNGEGVTRKRLDHEVVDEIDERLDWIRALLRAYTPPEAVDVPAHRAPGKNGHMAGRVVGRADPPAGRPPPDGSAPAGSVPAAS